MTPLPWQTTWPVCHDSHIDPFAQTDNLAFCTDRQLDPFALTDNFALTYNLALSHMTWPFCLDRWPFMMTDNLPFCHIRQLVTLPDRQLDPFALTDNLTLLPWHTTWSFALTDKFEQNTNIRNFLLSTKGKSLVEASMKDLFWECGIALRDHVKMLDIHNWSSKNLLGKLLEEVRDELSISA